MKTKIICGFPGIGKSHFKEYAKGVIVMDSDSSQFDKAHFPSNYIAHIMANIGKCHYILVSSHKDVRDALVANNIHFLLVYPSLELKDEYLQRYRKRGSSEGFIKLLDANWYYWIADCMMQKDCLHLKLIDGAYLSDVIK